MNTYTIFFPDLFIIIHSGGGGGGGGGREKGQLSA